MPKSTIPAKVAILSVLEEHWQGCSYQEIREHAAELARESDEQGSPVLLEHVAEFGDAVPDYHAVAEASRATLYRWLDDLVTRRLAKSVERGWRVSETEPSDWYEQLRLPLADFQRAEETTAVMADLGVVLGQLRKLAHRLRGENRTELLGLHLELRGLLDELGRLHNCT